MILLTGAGGKTGKTLVRLLSKDESVAAFVHHEKQISTLESLGAEKVIAGDLRSETDVHSAMQGVQSVYCVCPNMHPDEVGIGKLVIAEAQKAGVEHFVYHSVLHPQTEKMSHHWGKLRVEEMIFESGLPFTILQPAPYMQNLLAGWNEIVNQGIVHVPYSVRAKFSFIDLEDIAAVAQIVLTESGHKNSVYELAGTPPLSHIEVAEILGRGLNLEIQAEKEELREWRLRARGLSEYALENLIRMFEYYDKWGLAGNPNVLRWILKREPTSLESFAKRTMRTHNVLR